MWFLSATASCAVSVLWLDRPIARGVAKVLPPGKFESHVPDLLVPLVAAVSLAAVVLWVAARVRRSRPLAELAFLVGFSGPFALGVKYFAKWVFGRGRVEFFLVHPAAREFHWFHGHGPFLGFPSGHMLIATAWVVVVGAYFPRLRAWGWLALGLLAAALMLGSYHFLGDIIAGTFLGACVGWLTIALDARWQAEEGPRTPRAVERGPS